jgi:hypothetical protein
MYESRAEYLSREEFLSACAHLSDGDLVELNAAGDMLALGLCSRSGVDLFSEAILRTADGKRQCPRHLQERIRTYLIMTMRSIASGVRKHENAEAGRLPIGWWRCF